MADSCLLNWPELKTRAFGLYSWIVIGQTRQLILSANHNLLAQTKSPGLQLRPVYHADLRSSVLWSETPNVEVKNRVPDLSFNINESVFYSHKYFKKISVEKDGIQTSAGLCLMCQEDKNKEVLIKITDGNTKGLKMDMQSAHTKLL